jgi:hypothetical protein
MDTKNEMIAPNLLDKFFQNYASCFENFDVSSLVTCFTSPFSIIHKRGITSFPSESNALNNLAPLLELYKKRNLIDATFTILNKTPVKKGQILVTLKWDLSDGNNLICDSFKCIYHLINEGEELKILLVTNFEENLD